MLRTFSGQLKQFPSNIHTFFSYLYISFHRPSILVIELSSMCNAKCTMCYKEESNRIKEHMDYELFKKIVDDAQSSNIDKIQLSFYGESLLYPQLIDAISYIREKIPKAFITINTNGMLLNPKLAKEMLDAGINSIAISIEGNNREEYENIRLKLKWNILKENIKAIREMIDKGKYSTKIGIMGLNVGDIQIDEKEYIKTWGEYADTMFVRNEFELNDKKRESSFHKLMPCNKILSQIVVMTSGDVTMCAYDWEAEVKYGNIKDNTLIELWNNPALKKKRSMHLWGKKKQVKLCDNCSYRVDDFFKKSNLL